MPDPGTTEIDVIVSILKEPTEERFTQNKIILRYQFGRVSCVSSSSKVEEKGTGKKARGKRYSKNRRV